MSFPSRLSLLRRGRVGPLNQGFRVARHDSPASPAKVRENRHPVNDRKRSLQACTLDDYLRVLPSSTSTSGFDAIPSEARFPAIVAHFAHRLAGSRPRPGTAVPGTERASWRAERRGGVRSDGPRSRGSAADSGALGGVEVDVGEPAE